MPSASSTSSQQSSSTLPEHWPAWLLTGLPSLLCLMVCALLAYAVQQSHAQRDLTAQQDRVKQQLQVMRDRLVAQAQVAFSPTAGVSTLIQTDVCIPVQRDR